MPGTVQGRLEDRSFGADRVIAPVCSKLRSVFETIAEDPVPDPLLVLAGRLEAKLQAEDEARRRGPPRR